MAPPVFAARMVIGMSLAPPEPPLADEVVALRPWRADDAPAVAAVIDGDPEIASWLDQVPQPYGLDEAHAYIAACRRGWEEGTGASFAVLDAADERAVPERQRLGAVEGVEIRLDLLGPRRGL